MADTNNTTEPLVFTYWENQRGTIQPLIYLLEYLKVPYTFKTVKGDQEFAELKKTLKNQGVKFPSLPSIEHNGKYISEMRAMASYITTLAGRTDLHAGHKDFVEWVQLECILGDTLGDILRAAHTATDVENLKKIYPSWALRHKSRFVDLAILIKDRGFLLGGEQVTYLDFFLAELTERLVAMETDLEVVCLSKFDGLNEHLEKVLAVPEIKAYREKDHLNLIGAAWNRPTKAVWH